MKDKNFTMIGMKDICNLSRIPINIDRNPCFLTALQYKSGDVVKSQSALCRHYKTYNPETIYDFYGKVEKLKNYSSTYAFLPWIFERPMKQLIDTAFIQNPTPELLLKQEKKIFNLVDSFETHGYRPELFLDRKAGNITGYFIKSGDVKRFYIVSGNHRTSVFFALNPDIKLPVAYEVEKYAKPREMFGRARGSFLNVYDLSDAARWPSVKSGFLNVEEARQIAEVYLYV